MKESIKIGNNVIRFDAITEVYVGDNDGKLWIFTEDSMFDFSPSEYDVATIFAKVTEYLHIIESF